MSSLPYVLQINARGAWSDLRANPMHGDETSYDNVGDASSAAQRLAQRSAYRIRVKRTVDSLIVDEYDASGERPSTFSTD